MKTKGCSSANLEWCAIRFYQKGVIKKINNIKCDNVMTNATWLAGHRGEEMINCMGTNTEQRRHAQAAPSKVI